MATMLIALSGGVHTGACMAVPRAIARVRRSARARPAEPTEHEYCLHDEDGNRPFCFPSKVPGFEHVVPDLDRVNPA